MNKWAIAIVIVLIISGYTVVHMRTAELPSSSVSDVTAGIDIDATKPAQSIPEASVATHIDLPADPIELLATGVTGFGGSSADRIANITVGVSSISGTVVHADEEFSTVAALGDITAEKGYKEEKVYRDGAIASGLGGGLCQVSTTLFQAVLAAGLPVTERTNHTFTVPYYPKGLDATIAGPHPDFRFVNDTGHDMLIMGTVKDGKATFTLKGIPDGRTATVSPVEITEKDPADPTRYVPVDFLAPGEQKCVGSPHDGFKTSVDYTITYPDGTVKDKTFDSTYRSLTEICYIGAAR